MMRRRWLLFGIYLLACTTFMWGQLPAVPGAEEPKRLQRVHHHDRRVNFGIKGGFTSLLFLISDLALNGTVINRVQNNYRTGYFGSFFMRMNFKRHFLQSEFSCVINRCNIAFEKPFPGDASENSTPEVASTTSFIHSFEIPVVYGYNVIREGPYSPTVLGGPKTRYIWGKKSKITSENFDQRDIKGELHLLNVSLTADVTITIFRIFSGLRYGIGLCNISKCISYKPIYDESVGEGTILANQIRFHRRGNALSFSLGVFF